MKKNMSRRNFLMTSATGAIATNSFAQTSGTRANAGDITYVPFIDQYYYGTLDMLKAVRETQIDNINAAMRKAWELQNNGGRIFSHVLMGHYAMFAGSPCLPGQPNVLPQRVDRNLREDFAAMKEGDFLITSYANNNVLEAKSKGVYVVGVTNNYILTAKTPPDFLEAGTRGPSIEEVSDLVIDSHCPYENGLVAVPGLTELKVCPAAGAAQYFVYWPCTAVLADLIATNGRGSRVNPAEKYLDLVLEKYQMIYTDRPKFNRIAETWADLVLNKKARLLLYGHHQDVAPYLQTMNTFVNDAYICSSGSMIADVYDLRADTLTENDIVFITSLFSNHPDEINVARRSRSIGAYTTAFCPYALQGDSSGVRLFKEVDAVFNTYCEEPEGVIEIPGLQKKVAPLAGLTGNLVHWMLMADWTDHMFQRGETPYYWKGYHEKGGRDYDNAVEPLYKIRGY